MTIVTLSEARRRLADLIERAARGEDIVIARRGAPVALLTATEPRRARREPAGALRFQQMDADFDAPDVSIVELFGRRV